MAVTFDVTLKDMGRDSPRGFLAAFDRRPTGPVKLLNVDLSSVTTAADLVLGLGEPLEEVIQPISSRARRPGSTPTCWSTTRCCSRTTACRCTRPSSCCARKQAIPI